MEFLPLDPQTLINAMKETSTYDMFEDVVLYFLRKSIQNQIVPAFLHELEKLDCNSTFIAIRNLHESMCWFYDYVALDHKAEKIKEKMNDILRACIKWRLKTHVVENFMRTYTFSFQFYLQEHTNCTDLEDASNNLLMLYFKDEEKEVIFQEFKVLQEKKFIPMVQKWLVDLGLVKMLRDDIVMNILKTEVDRYVVKVCNKQYEQSWIGDEKDVLGNWTKSLVLPWLQMVFHVHFNKSDWEEKLLYILYNSYTKLRINEMLNIITEYPDSVPVLHDLKLCLQHTRQRPSLIRQLRQEISNRVLHPGVSTQNIITVYIAAVKALRELDVSGVVMETVMEPCTAYLMQREDSVRMIMQGLLWDDGSNDLAAELASNQKHEDHVSSAAELVTKQPEDWLPDPREADPQKSDKSTRTSDIVTLFIAMYGSKEKFIKEYQKLLSKRLLQTWCTDRNESNEIRNLELLKKRFGEDGMSKCAVMLKDIADSRRINANIREERKQAANVSQQAFIALQLPNDKAEFNLQTFIVSSEFWPEITNQEFELPTPINDTFNEFNKDYESLKVSRSLSWQKSVGMVDIELQFDDRTIEVKVTPLQATIIWHFQDKGTWSLSELSDQLKIPPTTLSRKMSYWIQQGMIKQVNSDCFELIERHDKAQSSSESATSAPLVEHVRLGSLEEDDDEDVGEDSAQKEKNEQILWNYIQGMLKNLESLPLDRIHKMLQMFLVHDDNLQMELPQLRDLLSGKINKGFLLFENGKYKLVREAS